MTAKRNFYSEGKYCNLMDNLVTSITKRSADDEIYTSRYFNVLVSSKYLTLRDFVLVFNFEMTNIFFKKVFSQSRDHSVSLIKERKQKHRRFSS